MTDATTREKPVDKISRVDSAYRQLKTRILNNDFPPGFRALEQEVAEMLDMSRTPVREAIIRLDNEGLVKMVPRRGMMVVPLVPADMKEIYEVLTALEAMAAEILARRKPSAEDLVPLELALKHMDDALAADDLEAWAEADDQYHRVLLELSGNKRLISMASTMRDQGHRARLVTLRLRPKPWQSNVEHREVFDAIRSGDWKTAREAHYQHRERSSMALLEILESYRLPPL